MDVLLAVVAALVTTAVAVPVCVRVARRWGIVDRPGPLKPHDAAVPYLGGVGVFAGVAVAASFSRPIALVPLVAALGVGVGDDGFDLPAPARLAAQLGVGALVAITQPVHVTGWIGVPLVMAATVVLINGFNLLDGLDMLATGVGAVAAVGFAVTLHGPARLFAASLVGSLAAFLWYNRPPARIYLGDGGSYLIGAAMAVLLTYGWGVGVAGPTGVIVLALLAIPVAEVACAMMRRLRAGSSLLAGDRAHPYDLLVAKGWPRTAASAAYVVAEAGVVTVVAVVSPPSMALAVAIDVVVGLAVLCGAALLGGFSDPAGTRP